MVEYDRAAQARAADDLASLPAESPVLRFMADYKALRDQARACASAG